MTVDQIIAALRAERKRRRWTQTHVAQLIGTTQPVISRYENGKVTPHADTLCQWAAALERPLTPGGGPT